MSDVPANAVPAGWYPDPAGSFQQRWWNGNSWTNDFAQYRPSLVHAAAAPTAEDEALIARQQAAQRAADEAAVAIRRQRESYEVRAYAAQRSATPTLTRHEVQPETDVRADPLPTFRLPSEDQAPQTTVAQPNAASATLIPIVSPSRQNSYGSSGEDSQFGSAYQPFNGTPEVRKGVVQRAERAHTVSVWLLPFVPVFVLAGIIAVALFASSYYTLIALGIAVVVFFAASVGLAARDARTLSKSGHYVTVAPGWVFLTPVAYLILRTAAVTRETNRVVPWPLLASLVVYAGLVAAIYLVPGAVTLLLGITAL